MPWDELKPRKFAAFERDLDGISRQTMDDHYKLYQGYAKNANECRRILNDFEYSKIEGNQAYSPLRAVSVDYTFALLGYKDHDLYFRHLGSDGGEPTGRFAELIDGEFNGVDKWQNAVRKAASAARGWVMVGYDLNDGSLFNYIMDTQNLWADYKGRTCQGSSSSATTAQLTPSARSTRRAASTPNERSSSMSGSRRWRRVCRGRRWALPGRCFRLPVSRSGSRTPLAGLRKKGSPVRASLASPPSR
jgi:superoxide dismutase